ncbi:MAG: hypothetical protein NUW01_11175 [Gemmatimonadaceae bacterium]|nr:hypothetical protein [Gemmatimonadaceae bacterium]
MSGDSVPDRRKATAPPPAFLAPHTRRTDKPGAPEKRECLAWYCRRAVRVASQVLGAVALLSAGTVFAISRQPLHFAKPGELLSLPVAVVQPNTQEDEIRRVSRVLRLHTKDTLLADRIARVLALAASC